MKIRFLETYKVKAADGPEYKAGEVYDLSESSAQHFLRKGRAEIVIMTTVTTPEVLPPDAIEKTEQKPGGDKGTLGTRGGDPVRRFQEGQKSYRKKALEGDKE